MAKIPRTQKRAKKVEPKRAPKKKVARIKSDAAKSTAKKSVEKRTESKSRVRKAGKSNAAGTVGAPSTKRAAAAKKTRPNRASAKKSPKKSQPAKKAAKKSTTTKRPATKAAGAGAPPKRATHGSPKARSVDVGGRAPAFALPDQTGATVRSSDLNGHPYVLYFYPKDNTPGCTNEACGFRDAHPDFSRLGVRVFGVSADSSRSHAGFVEKFELPFTLLSDPNKELIDTYGCWVKKHNYGREYMGIERSTFLVDASGVIADAWRSVKVNGHVEAVLEAAGKLS